MSERAVSIMDFWPPHQVAIEDFYPDGFVFAKALPKRSMGPDAAGVLIALAERLKVARDTEIELLTIMEFCDNLLQMQGVNMRITHEPNAAGPAREGGV